MKGGVGTVPPIDCQSYLNPGIHGCGRIIIIPSMGKQLWLSSQSLRSLYAGVDLNLEKKGEQIRNENKCLWNLWTQTRRHLFTYYSTRSVDKKTRRMLHGVCESVFFKASGCERGNTEQQTFRRSPLKSRHPANNRGGRDT